MDGQEDLRQQRIVKTFYAFLKRLKGANLQNEESVAAQLTAAFFSAEVEYKLGALEQGLKDIHGTAKAALKNQ